MSEWQPIETAPKDGTRVLLFLPHSNPMRRYCFGEWMAEHGAPVMPEGWYRGPHFSIKHEMLSEPTHWASLPEAPK